ncbi:hypothetical protein EDD85DRAFT_1029083 [Armillaria nabsnona]|nr:hypothetical protein EDD85DRAFT_1029083 [Armillaria nabsnona]
MPPPPTLPQHGPSVPGYPTDADKARAAAFTLKMQEAKNRRNSDGHAGNMLASGSGGNGYSPSTILSTANLTGLRNVVNGKTELFVVYLTYEDRVQTKVPHELGGIKSRQGSRKNAPEMQSVMIRQSAFTSTYCHDSSSKLVFPTSVETSSAVIFQIARLEIDESGSISDLEWSEQVFHGTLQDQPMTKGLMKKVYKLTMPTLDRGSRWVAKHFFNVGHSIEDVDIQENMTQLYEEVVTQKKGEYFLDKFYECAEETDISISMHIVPIY